MSEIKLPRGPWKGNIDSVAKLTSFIEQWHDRKNVSKEGESINRIWFRGNPKRYAHPLRPKVYRDPFTKKAKELYPSHSDPCFTLERELLKEFRMSGALHFDSNNVGDVYFVAQHFGMPTRLLDWTMNPLIALFFAAKDCPDDHGEFFIMDALGVLPDTSAMTEEQARDIPTEVLTMRDGHVTQSLARSFWVCPEPQMKIVPNPTPSSGATYFTATGGGWTYEYPKGWILPVRPDNRPGRIGQQSSCFTLHEIGSDDQINPTLDKFMIAKHAKETIRDQLRRLNINEYTIYNDLDHLSAAICDSWKIPKDPEPSRFA